MHISSFVDLLKNLGAKTCGQFYKCCFRFHIVKTRSIFTYLKWRMTESGNRERKTMNELLPPLVHSPKWAQWLELVQTETSL